MASLHSRGFAAQTRSSVPYTPPRAMPQKSAEPRPSGLMRKYDIKALVDGTGITEKQIVAPATEIFEHTATAFARGTLIATDRGPMAVEDLLPGDMAMSGNKPVPIVWIGSTTYVPNVDARDSQLTRLFRITAEAFGFGRPATDILVGPGARMTLRRERLRSIIGKDTVLVPVSDYCDGDRIFEVNPPGAVQMFHVALARHGTLNVSGFEMESYHPGRNAGSELGQTSRALFLSMFPNLERLDDFGEVTLTRTSREVIENLIVG